MCVKLDNASRRGGEDGEAEEENKLEASTKAKGLITTKLDPHAHTSS